ncbi:hypothetical protein [Terricaulis silvestris]|uniref:Uncharacterized protein n=1 Tax=Terricaulis silvestris TaxID=2686094 RepID=A0A6I6MWA0_9CAUL|nr:hypothetical protein [Terricaulis silvestris]QGZ95473.1 hypothetical protein DSM104635_02322 [Terricaulis silvestris]
MPFTALIRSFSVVVIVIGAIMFALGVASVVLSLMGRGIGYLSGADIQGSLALMLTASLVYVLCRMHEARAATDEQAALLIEILAQLRADRTNAAGQDTTPEHKSE